MSGYHVIVEGKTGADEGIAGQAMQSLTEAYPGHPWHVNVRDGLIIVKHLRLSGKWGQIKHTTGIYSASDLKKAMVTLGGEFLERAGMRRGAPSEGEYKRIVEGIPTKDLVIG
jgi:hypothetical protein